MLLFILFFLGSGPDRGQRPVERGDFPLVRLFVCLSVLPSFRTEKQSKHMEMFSNQNNSKHTIHSSESPLLQTRSKQFPISRESANSDASFHSLF